MNLIMKLLERNGLSTNYLDYPYQYTRMDGVLTALYKKDEVIYLDDEEEEEYEFYVKCIRAKQQGRSITEVIKTYFPD
jgi:hypothetical protein